MASKIGRLSTKSSILLLCDMQEKFAKNISHFNEIVQSSAKAVDFANSVGLPYLVTEQYPRGLGHTVPQLKNKLKNTKIFEKTQFSMCTKELMDHINKTMPSYNSVILCGIEAHACILESCLDFLQAGKDVHVLVDAVSSRTLTDRKYAFERMKQSGAFLTTSESIVFQICRDAGHPKFKEVQKLLVAPTPDSSL